MYYVYALVDPRTNQPFYIGKGTKNRVKVHLRSHGHRHSNREKLNIIASIRENGQEPIIKIIRNSILSEPEAYAVESEWIRFYGRKSMDKGGILTNICLDTKPRRCLRSLSPHNLERDILKESNTKQKVNHEFDSFNLSKQYTYPRLGNYERSKRGWTDQQRKNYNETIASEKRTPPSRLGALHSPDTRRRISKSLSGIAKTDVHCKKISESHSAYKNPMAGRKHTDESKRKMKEAHKTATRQLRPVYLLVRGDEQYHLTTKMLGEFCKTRNLCRNKILRTRRLGIPCDGWMLYRNPRPPMGKRIKIRSAEESLALKKKLSAASSKKAQRVYCVSINEVKQTVNTSELRNLCLQHQISIHMLMAAKRKSITYKGWVVTDITKIKSNPYPAP
jgi:hypothetical protein